jgi:PHS family inorganic phosphate transporter-like MFS transporter
MTRNVYPSHQKLGFSSRNVYLLNPCRPPSGAKLVRDRSNRSEEGTPVTSTSAVTGESAFTSGAPSVSDLLNEAPRSKFHRRTVLVSGVGFFTDAYDLFVISTVAALIGTEWRLSTLQTSWVTGSAILGAFFGALIFGRLADVFGRKKVYTVVAGIMIVGALASAVAPGFIWLVIARFVLGLGIGGDYPVSAVLMSEYSNRKDRGRLVGMVFSMQALGLIVGPLVGLVLLSSGINHELTWRLMLGLGAIPAAGVIYLRAKMPESPRFKSQVQGKADQAGEDIASYSDGVVEAPIGPDQTTQRLGLGQFLRNRRMLLLLMGTAGSWFLFDYAYYGNTLSLPAILKEVDSTASLETKLLWTLGLFLVFAVPGYVVAVMTMDRIGHRRLQFIGFAVMAGAFLTLAGFAHLTTMVVPFLAIFGLSYFFVEFGPNMTTFVLPSEVFPVSMRTTGHGIAAGIGKLGAFVGVFLVPQLQKHYGLRGMLAIAGIAAILGFALTSILPEPSRRNLEDMHSEFDAPKISPPKISPPQVTRAFDDAQSALPLIVQQSPDAQADVLGDQAATVRETLTHSV